MPEAKSATRVLIIEDEPLLALTLEDQLVDAGFEVVGVVGRVDTALAMIVSAVFDVAIVDANLAGRSASPAASALTARGIPFILLSGYSIEQLSDEFVGAHFIKKPCRPSQLIQALRDIVLKH